MGGTALEGEFAPRARQVEDVLQQKSPSQHNYGTQLNARTVARVMKQAGRFLERVKDSLPQLAVSPADP